MQLSASICVKKVQRLESWQELWVFASECEADTLKIGEESFNISIYMDKKDKSKQRVVLTDYCDEFCAKNKEMSNRIMIQMFEGISSEQLQVTIQTIMQVEEN